jgi:hypothetical protein
MKEKQPKQSARWQHLFRLKACAFFSLQKNGRWEVQQLLLGIGNAILSTIIMCLKVFFHYDQNCAKLLHFEEQKKYYTFLKH